MRQTVCQVPFYCPFSDVKEFGLVFQGTTCTISETHFLKERTSRAEPPGAWRFLARAEEALPG